MKVGSSGFGFASIVIFENQEPTLGIRLNINIMKWQDIIKDQKFLFVPLKIKDRTQLELWYLNIQRNCSSIYN